MKAKIYEIYEAITNDIHLRFLVFCFVLALVGIAIITGGYIANPPVNGSISEHYTLVHQTSENFPDLPANLHPIYYTEIQKIHSSFLPSELKLEKTRTVLLEAYQHEIPKQLWCSPPDTIIEDGTNVEGYTYIIFTDGSYYYAKNGSTGEIEFSNSNIASLVSLCSGNIRFSPGIFSTTGITLHSGITKFEGAGSGTIFYLADGSNTDVLAGTGLNHVTISDLQIDGNNASNSNCNGISLTLVNNSTIENMHIHNCRLKGIALSGCADNQIINNYINYTDSDGIVLASQSGGANSQRNLVQGNNINGAHAYGIGIVTPTGGDPHPRGEKIINNFITNLTVGNNLNGINVKGADNILIQGNIIDTAQNGILFGADGFSSNNSTITDNTILSATGNSIQLEDAHNVTVSNNKCLLGGSWSVYSDADSSWNMVFDNDIASNPTKIQLNGNNEIARNNKGTAPFNWGITSPIPTAYGEGDSYYNSGSSVWYTWDGSSWRAWW